MDEIWFDLINTNNGEVYLFTDSLNDVISFIRNNYFMSFSVNREDREDGSTTYKIYVF